MQKNIKKKIFGGHISEYMTKLKEENGDKYAKHFSKYIEAGVEPDGIEDMYRKIHAAIRKNPASAPKKQVDRKAVKSKWPKVPRISIEERKKRRNDKLQQVLAAAKAQNAGNANQQDVEMSDNEE